MKPRLEWKQDPMGENQSVANCGPLRLFAGGSRLLGWSFGVASIDDVRRCDVSLPGPPVPVFPTHEAAQLAAEAEARRILREALAELGDPIREALEEIAALDDRAGQLGDAVEIARRALSATPSKG